MDKVWLKERICEYVSYLLAAALLLLIFPMRLLPCLLAGMIAYEIISYLSGHISKVIRIKAARWVAVFLISLLVIGSMVYLIAGTWNVLSSDFSSRYDLYNKINVMLQEAQKTLIPVIGDYLPQDYEDFHNTLFGWLQNNLSFIQMMGQRVLHFVAIVLIGLLLAAIVSLDAGGKRGILPPLPRYLTQRISVFREAFRAVVFAQIKVAAVNALLTAFFLYLVMPLLGYHLPYVKSVIVITFFCGLLPIIGNLISNVIIVTIGLSVSMSAGAFAMGFLILVHKMEYFINAKIFGGKIDSRTWELLLVMLLFEALFGLYGVVAAPVYYAYLKMELKKVGVI